jgi:hypothetical protein
MAVIDCRTHLVRDHVRKARTMAVFAADRKLREGRIGEVPVALRRGIWPATMAEDAAG